MRFLLSISVTLLCLNGITAQAGQVITRLSNGSSTFYYLPPLGTNSPQDAIDNASVGDTIILPGGQISGAMNVDRQLVVVGAGIVPAGTPVTQRTTFPAVVIGSSFVISANGSSFHGIAFGDEVNVQVANISFVRCEFASPSPVNLDPPVPPSANGVQFKQCIFRTGMHVGDAQNIAVNNCIVQQDLSIFSSAANISVSQSMFLLGQTNVLGGGTTDSDWTNNIFVIQNNNTFNLDAAGTYSNNLFALTGNPTMTLGASGTYNNNLSVPLGTLGTTNPNFGNISSTTTYNYNEPTADDYELVLGGAADLMIGIGGDEVGIHGGPPGNPWKEDAIPFNPHWVGLFPPGASLGVTTGGTLNVTIQGEAQQD